jgi:fatty acid desaturase
MDNTFISPAVAAISRSRYWALPRIALDFLLWIGLAVAANALHRWWVYAIVALIIGGASMHDLLVQGHEGTHELISRNHMVNELASWLCFALFGMSAVAHRDFHTDHHRCPHTERDPEYRLFDRVVRGVPGWAYLIIPAAAPLGVNSYPFRMKDHARDRVRATLELMGALVLHGLILWATGLRNYLLFVAAPAASGLYLVTVCRSICEHHHVASGDDWTNARSVVTNPLTEFAWSNVNYHLEHHLYPQVPFHKLPALRRLLAQDFEPHHSVMGKGFLHTAASLIQVKQHFTAGSQENDSRHEQAGRIPEHR